MCSNYNLIISQYAKTYLKFQGHRLIHQSNRGGEPKNREACQIKIESRSKIKVTYAMNIHEVPFV